MIARCKACGHSWNIETYDGKRKRKCPECGKYQVEYINPEDIDLTKELDKNAARKIKKSSAPNLIRNHRPKTSNNRTNHRPKKNRKPNNPKPRNSQPAKPSS